MPDKINDDFFSDPAKKIIAVISSPSNIALASFTFFLFGIVFQVAKITFGSDNFLISNLNFVSPTSTLTDFIYLIGNTLLKIISYLIILLIVSFGSFSLYAIIYNIRKNFIVTFLLKFLFYLYYIGIFIGFTYIEAIIRVNKNLPVDGSFLLYKILLAILSSILLYLTYSIFSNKILDNQKIYSLLGWFFSINILILIFFSPKMYACTEKNVDLTKLDTQCELLVYKNDKYGFTGKGDVYEITQFKSFFTEKYINSLK